MLLKKKNIVINIPDYDKASIEKHLKDGYNEYNELNIYKPFKANVRKKRNML